MTSVGIIDRPYEMHMMSLLLVKLFTSDFVIV